MTCLPGILPPASAGVGGSQKGSLRPLVSVHDDLFNAPYKVADQHPHPQHIGSFDISAMLIRAGEVIYWSGVIGAVLWLGVGIWVYYVDPNPPSEATFVLLMFVGSAILIYWGGWCVRYVISGKKNIT
jgi:hypothetical protein